MDHTHAQMSETCSAIDHYTILACLLKLLLKPYYMTKSPTKAPIALYIYLAGPLFDFLTSIFEFFEAARGWQPQKIDLLDPFRLVSQVKFLVASLL